MPSVVLPEPDSPTMPSVSPRRSCSVALLARRWNWRLPNQPSRDGEARRRRRRACTSTGASVGHRLHHALRPAGQQAAGCRGAAGGRTPSAVSPISTSRPRSITPTRWVKRRTRFRSWVMNSSAMPISRLQLVEQRQDLRLDGDVQRGGRLVADQQLAAGRPAPWRSSRAGAGRPTAGADRRRRGARARGCRCAPAARWRARAPAFGRSASCSSSTSPIWLPTVYSGFSAVIGSWKIMPMRAPRMPRISRSLLAHQVLAVEADRAAGGGRIDQPQHRQRGDRLARARFADQRELLARRRSLNDTSSTTVRGAEAHAQVLDLEQRLRRIVRTSGCRRRRAARRR